MTPGIRPGPYARCHAQENGGFTTDWSIQPLKCVTFVEVGELRQQEQASLEFWRAHVPGLLNRNDCVDQNARRRERARAWRVANGQGARDPVTGRSQSYHAQYCAAWRQRRREQAQALRCYAYARCQQCIPVPIQ